jgi:hypothetical protein
MKKIALLALALVVAITVGIYANNNSGGEVGVAAEAAPETEAAEAAEAAPEPGLTDEVNAVALAVEATPEPQPAVIVTVAERLTVATVIETEGEANIEREEETLGARAGMRLFNLDTLRTLGESSAWLGLDEDRAARLGEMSVLLVERKLKGFALTLLEGEVTAQIDRPLDEGEEFTVVAGNLALAVRGTVFTVRLDRASNVVTVSVERGEVAVIDPDGNELATITESENMSFDAETGIPPATGGTAGNANGNMNANSGSGMTPEEEKAWAVAMFGTDGGETSRPASPGSGDFSVILH